MPRCYAQYVPVDCPTILGRLHFILHLVVNLALLLITIKVHDQFFGPFPRGAKLGTDLPGAPLGLLPLLIHIPPYRTLLGRIGDNECGVRE
jgi:hypothetical protein